MSIASWKPSCKWKNAVERITLLFALKGKHGNSITASHSKPEVGIHNSEKSPELEQDSAKQTQNSSTKQWSLSGWEIFVNSWNLNKFLLSEINIIKPNDLMDFDSHFISFFLFPVLRPMHMLGECSPWLTWIARPFLYFHLFKSHFILFWLPISLPKNYFWLLELMVNDNKYTLM